MAGAGIKLWATADTVTATEFQTYLQEQVVAVFDDSSARDAAFGGAGEPTLAEGMSCYLKDTNEFQVYSGSAWVPLLDLDTWSVSSGAYTIKGDVTVGVDGTGHDWKAFGDTAGSYALWDQSEDELRLIDSMLVVGNTTDAVDMGLVGGVATIRGINVGTSAYNDLSIRAGSGTQLYLDTSGDVGIGTDSPDQPLTVGGNLGGYGLHVDSSTGAGIELDRGASTNAHSVLFQTAGTDDWAITNYNDGDALCIKDGGYNGTEIARFTPTGLIVGGTTAFSDPEEVALTVVGNLGQTVVGASTVCDFLLRNDTADSTWLMSHRASGGGNALQWWYHNGTSWVGPQLGITTAGAVAIAGALSKGSGSFDIPHPTRGGDWRLRHSFIEGPQADLIYRGTVTLSGGTATIDLDTASHMTDGTWEALCRDPWAMVASSGNAVEWVLDGKTLTITGPADAVCNWMVIAERQDDHMKSPEGSLADEDGYLIVEYEREASPPPAPPEEAEEAAA